MTYLSFQQQEDSFRKLEIDEFLISINILLTVQNVLELLNYFSFVDFSTNLELINKIIEERTIYELKMSGFSNIKYQKCK